MELSAEEFSEESYKSLDKRISYMETLLGGSSDGGSVMSKISFVERKTNEAQSIPIKELAKKLEQIDALISNYKNLTSVYLSRKEKGRLLIMSEDFLTSIFANLSELSNLKRFLDFAPIMEHHQKLKTLVPLQNDISEQFDRFQIQNERIDKLIAINGEIINDLNKKFLYLDMLVSKIEEEQQKNK